MVPDKHIGQWYGDATCWDEPEFKVSSGTQWVERYNEMARDPVLRARYVADPASLLRETRMGDALRQEPRFQGTLDDFIAWRRDAYAEGGSRTRADNLLP